MSKVSKPRSFIETRARSVVSIGTVKCLQNKQRGLGRVIVLYYLCYSPLKKQLKINISVNYTGYKINKQNDYRHINKSCHSGDDLI